MKNFKKLVVVCLCVCLLLVSINTGLWDIKVNSPTGYSNAYAYENATPISTISSSVSISNEVIKKEEYQINKYGETYGSSFYATTSEEPDLIKAIGVNGEEGYVKASDVDPKEPATPEEAIEYNKKYSGTRFIRLYNADGDEIIGEFKIN